MTRQTPPPVYLDYNATAPLLPAARQAMEASLDAVSGNPSSPHGFGQSARAALEGHRAVLAELTGWERAEVLFTSGGTESNNTLLRSWGQGRRPGHILTTPVEHPSILRTVDWLKDQGMAVSYLPVDTQGVVRVEALADLLRPDTRMVSVMAANNETGVVQPLQAVAAELRRLDPERRVWLHTDASQALGRIPLMLKAWGFDAVTLTAHKLGGPKGIGAMILRRGRELAPLLLGGRQERGQRAGTESVFLAAGFAAAAQWACANLTENTRRWTALRDRLESRLSGLEGFFINGLGAPRLPNTSSLGMAGLDAQSLLVALDLHGVGVSAGSACSSGAVEPSHVLRAMGVSEDSLRGSLRISLGHATTEAEVDRCVTVLQQETGRLRTTRAAMA
ncbi:MAG: cysteine desulfurase [Deltaproteobacteria bacterium]|nr:cysteine desulfurase [Deltaproteobacteria bacterium]